MPLIPKVTTATVKVIPILSEKAIAIAALGTVPSTSWSNFGLSPHYYPKPQKVWEFDFVGSKPSGTVVQMDIPVTAAGIYVLPIWTNPALEIIRIVAEDNNYEVDITGLAPAATYISSTVKISNVILSRELCSYDDSFQPIGLCSLTSARMKKLHHTLTVTVTGPNEAQAVNCFNQAAAAGLVAAIVVAYSTGGLALQTAVAAFVTTLKTCLGNKFAVQIDDRSDWVEWCT